MKKIIAISIIATLFFAGCKRETIYISHTPKPQREVANNLVGTWELYQKQLYKDTTQFITDFEILDTIIFTKDSVMMKNTKNSSYRKFCSYTITNDLVVFADPTLSERFIYERIGQDSVKIAAVRDYFYNSSIYPENGFMYFRRIER